MDGCSENVTSQRQFFILITLSISINSPSLFLFPSLSFLFESPSLIAPTRNTRKTRARRSTRSTARPPPPLSTAKLMKKGAIATKSTLGEKKNQRPNKTLTHANSNQEEDETEGKETKNMYIIIMIIMLK